MSIAELAAAFNAANPFLRPDEQRLATATYRLLARGRPVADAELASEAGADEAWVRSKLGKWTGVFRDGDDRIVGFWGLALPAMDHRFEVDGRSLYAWCAWDPFFLAPLLETSARVTSTCPVTGTTITLRVGPDGVSEVQPPGAVLSFLTPTPDMCEDVINSFCHYVLLFASRAAAEKWVGEHPGTFVLDVDEAFELAASTLGRLGGARR